MCLSSSCSSCSAGLHISHKLVYAKRQADSSGARMQSFQQQLQTLQQQRGLSASLTPSRPCTRRFTEPVHCSITPSTVPSSFSCGSAGYSEVRGLLHRHQSGNACGRACSLKKRGSLAAHAVAGLPGLTYIEGYTEVEELRGVRLVLTAEPIYAEYLVKWKDGSEDTWERASNLSEDLLRAYEEKWWNAAKKADAETLVSMLAGGREVLANALDENRRSALHFAAATGNVDCTKVLLEAGAEVNIQDKEGYTPLHMAAGYMYTAPMSLLVEAGADPFIKDNKGLDVVQLLENLRTAMPLTIQTVQTCMRLEEAANCLTSQLYDEVEPSRILEVRTITEPPKKKKEEPPPEEGAEPKPEDPPITRRQFLVQFPDGRQDEWIDEANMAADVLADFEAGLEYAEAVEVIDVAQVGTERRFKVRWADDYPTSWEEEEHIPPALIALFQQQNPQLFEQRTSNTSSPDVSSGDGGVSGMQAAVNEAWAAARPVDHQRDTQQASSSGGDHSLNGSHDGVSAQQGTVNGNGQSMQHATAPASAFSSLSISHSPSEQLPAEGLTSHGPGNECGTSGPGSASSGAAASSDGSSNDLSLPSHDGNGVDGNGVEVRQEAKEKEPAGVA